MKTNFRATKREDGEHFRVVVEWDEDYSGEVHTRRVDIPTTYDIQTQIHTIKITDEALTDILNYFSSESK